MDTCCADIVIEFLSVAFHSILYYVQVYPKSVFETRKKYSVVVYRCIHPEINQYIELCLKSITECLKTGQLDRIEFSITNSTYKPVMKFVFDITSLSFNENNDAYLIQTEENFRAFCLLLSSFSERFKNLTEDRSFTINLHTSESTAVALSNQPNLQEFPLVQIDEVNDETTSILPLRRFSIKSHNFDTYIEFIGT